jgi:signal transduction histidine kinase
MEAIGRLAGGVAHDFNNLLTVIISFGRFVEEDLPEDSPSREDMEEVLRAARRAAELTRQLLAFSRRSTMSPRVVDLNDCIRDAERMLERLLGTDITHETALPASTGRVRIDPGLFEQVIVNLAVNARDAMPGGGTLRIETVNVEVTEMSTTAHEGFVDAGSYVRLVVADNGVGMDQATLARVFERPAVARCDEPRDQPFRTRNGLREPKNRRDRNRAARRRKY